MLMTQGSGQKVFEFNFELGENMPAVELMINRPRRHIVLDRYDNSFGTECKSRAYDNFIRLKASQDVKLKCFQEMPYDGLITREEVSK